MVDRNAELRATVRRLESNAKRKIRRNKAKGIQGVESFSPIRPSTELGSLDKRNLITYSHQLQRFNSRRNQYLADANKEAIPERNWKAYKKMERQYNAKVNDIFNEVADKVLPNGQSIRDRMNIVTPDHPQMANQAVNALFRPPSRDVSSINGMRALDKLQRKMERMNDPEYFDYRRGGDKETLDKMLATIGDEELYNRVSKLTDKQFDVLWNYTEFVTDVILTYESVQAALKDKNAVKDAFFEALDAGKMDSAYEHVQWVEDNV